MSRNPCIGWADGDPVTYPKSDGSPLAIGKVIIRKSYAEGKQYVKVQIQSVASGLGRIGEWVWPEGWVIGQGPKAGHCLDCRQEFRTADPDPSGFCLPCDRQAQREMAAASPIRRPHAYMHGARTPIERAAPGDLKEIAAQKARDDQESIF